MKVIYLAGPYRGERPIDIKHNIRAADILGEQVVEACGHLGCVPLIPHKNTEGYEGLQNDQYFLEATLEQMRRCDAVLLIPGWEKSVGAQGERAEALKLAMPVFINLSELIYWLENER